MTVISSTQSSSSCSLSNVSYGEKARSSEDNSQTSVEVITHTKLLGLRAIKMYSFFNQLMQKIGLENTTMQILTITIPRDVNKSETAAIIRFLKNAAFASAQYPQLFVSLVGQMDKLAKENNSKLPKTINGTYNSRVPIKKIPLSSSDWLTGVYTGVWAGSSTLRRQANQPVIRENLKNFYINRDWAFALYPSIMNLFKREIQEHSHAEYCEILGTKIQYTDWVQLVLNFVPNLQAENGYLSNLITPLRGIVIEYLGLRNVPITLSR